MAFALCVVTIDLFGNEFVEALAGFQGDQPKATAESYIDQWQDEAVRQMEKYGIPASITWAQGILESGNGASQLAQRSNNHFGIKCHSTWTGKRTYHDDDEKESVSGCTTIPWTAMKTTASSCSGIATRLFELELTDYKGWAKGLKACGYATDPEYANRLITLIERHDLHQFDEPGRFVLDEEELAAHSLNSNVSGEARPEPVNIREHDVVKKARSGGGSMNLERPIHCAPPSMVFSLSMPRPRYTGISGQRSGHHAMANPNVQ